MGGGAAALALRLHLALEAFHVHLEAVLAGDLLRQLQGETVGVVEAKRYVAWEHTLRRSCALKGLHNSDLSSLRPHLQVAVLQLIVFIRRKLRHDALACEEATVPLLRTCRPCRGGQSEWDSATDALNGAQIMKRVRDSRCVGKCEVIDYFLEVGLNLANLINVPAHEWLAARDGLGEALLLGLERAVDEAAALDELRVRRAHAVLDGLGDALEERALHPQLAGEADAAADDAAQHVAAALVRWHDAVGDEEHGRARMLRDDAQRDVGLLAGAVAHPRYLLHALDDGLEEIRLVERGDALHDGGDALQAQARVDARGREVRPRAVGRLVELREDEVPDLHETALGVVARRAFAVRMEVVVELARWAAGALGTGRAPEVVGVAAAADALGSDAYLVAPDGLGLVVALVHGHEEALGVEGQDVGDELPRPLDGLALEVVADAEVAQHLEEGQVREVADLVDVGGAEALLRRGEPPVGRLLVAGVVGLERHHARGGEQQRRVAGGYEGGAGHDEMTALLEEPEERGAYLVAGDGSLVGHAVPRPEGTCGCAVPACGRPRPARSLRSAAAACQRNPGLPFGPLCWLSGRPRPAKTR